MYMQNLVKLILATFLKIRYPQNYIEGFGRKFKIVISLVKKCVYQNCDVL